MQHNTPAHDTLWKLIQGIKFGMFTHRNASGMLHAHPLTTQNKTFDEDALLYFFVPRNGEIAGRIGQDPGVNISYADPGDDRYVSVSGDARLDESQAKKEALFSPMAKAWFPQGAADPNLALLAVQVHHAEYWDVDASKMVQLYKMAKAAMTGEQPRDLGEHKELHLS